MKKNYEITEKQLQFLEDYIKRKKRYTSIEDRLELLDHLVSDFEMTTENGNLSQYLADKSVFIYNYNSSKESDVHWSYQRQLWFKFFSFFYSLKMLPITYGTIFIFYILFLEMNIATKKLGFVFITLIIIPTIYSFIKTYHKNKQIRRLVSFKYLFNIMSLPNMFLYLFTPLADFLKEHKFLFFLYVIIGFGLHISGILLIIEKRKQILEKYKHLLN
ncbi:hypothetical protein JL193_10155 [Polaribacter batillariae]|uniref:DUF1129 domain-containing protein n=1 Tax=Polaribacter batillariae TaxID=2808900 RepID=A0ABX7ST32_9FLAO|nr:hypothetical protein [Polaribacter batillariae]QTD36510.1 hypothetical protein JL193_10155 [Polaribacter batillariae]